MKKIFSFLFVGLAAIMTANAQAEFTYEAGAELVSSYLWRGQYNGGLSFQPYLAAGYESEHTSLEVGAWFNLGASDWGFRKETTTTILGEEIGLGDGTYFCPEVDLSLMFSFYGVTVGFTHYYYFDGGNFFGWKKASDWAKAAITDGYESGSTTELTLGYNFSEILPEEHNLYINWNTMVAGNDFRINDSYELKQNYSSYLELGYDYTWDDLGLTLGGQIGFVPWASEAYYGNDKFAVKNLSIKLNKCWEFDACELDLFAQGMIDPDLMASDPETAFVKASGDEKIGCQSLNGTIGLGIWF